MTSDLLFETLNINISLGLFPLPAQCLLPQAGESCRERRGKDVYSEGALFGSVLKTLHARLPGDRRKLYYATAPSAKVME